MVPIALLLLTLVAAQNCPYCQWNACSITQTGFANCSACSYGALSTMQVYSPSQGAEDPQVVGVCQPCPVGCSSCQFATLCPAMSPCFLAMNCTQCESLYAYAYAYGGCVACPANCLTCETSGDLSNNIECTTCASGYGVNFTFGNPIVSSCFACPANCLNCQCASGMTCSVFTCTLCAVGYALNASNSNESTCYSTSTAQLQTGTEGPTGSSDSGAVIGLSIWGAVMSILAVVFVVLYFKQREEKAKPVGLLTSESQPRQVNF